MGDGIVHGNRRRKSNTFSRSAKTRKEKNEKKKKGETRTLKHIGRLAEGSTCALLEELVSLHAEIDDFGALDAHADEFFHDIVHDIARCLKSFRKEET